MQDPKLVRRVCALGKAGTSVVRIDKVLYFEQVDQSQLGLWL